MNGSQDYDPVDIPDEVRYWQVERGPDVEIVAVDDGETSERSEHSGWPTDRQPERAETIRSRGRRRGSVLSRRVGKRSARRPHLLLAPDMAPKRQKVGERPGLESVALKGFSSAPGATRTPNVLLRSHSLLALILVLTLVASCTTDEETAGTTGGEVTTEPTEAAPTTTTEATTTTTAAATTSTATAEHEMSGEADSADVVAATLAGAPYQDLAAAEDAGYGSTMDALGCFENAEKGGMGVHYLNESLMDGSVDITTPEALVYELDADGEIVGLVAHEYIIPVEAWTESEPPILFGVDLHQHSVLPLWVLHAWLWKDNPAGFFEDYNPTVRLCPEGVPVFGVDLP